MGVVPTKGQVALGDHLPPESPPTSPLHVRTVLLFPTSDASLASSSALSSCSLNAGLSIILYFVCCCQSFCVFWSQFLYFYPLLCVSDIIGFFVFSSVVLCFFHSCLYFPSRGLIFSPMVVHFTFAQSSRTSFYTAFSPRHRVQVRMSQDIEENKNISIQLEQNGMSTGCFCIFGNK